MLEIKNSEYKTCELGSRVDVAATNLVHGNPKRSKEAVSTLLLFVLYTPPISDFILYYPCLPIRYSIYSGEDTAVWISIEREREIDC